MPDDGYAGTLVARVWRPAVQGPSVVTLREEGVFDVSAEFPTMATRMEQPEPAHSVQQAPGQRIGSLEDILANSDESQRDAGKPFFLAPCDLQVIKAAGVTFATSLIERLIEEQADGAPAKAEEVRARVVAQIGTDLAALKPGSEQAMRLKTLLEEQGLWSQYLEVGIGPDAEMFSKAPVLSSVGTGADIGIRSDSSWNNPEPEVVLASTVAAASWAPRWATTSTCATWKAAAPCCCPRPRTTTSCAIGPFMRLFDASFGAWLTCARRGSTCAWTDPRALCWKA